MAPGESDPSGSTDTRAVAEGSQTVGPQSNPDAEKTQDDAKDEDDTEFTRLESSWCHSCRYLKSSSTLEVVFHDGYKATYDGVDNDTAEGLKTSSSPGSYIWKHWPPRKHR